MLLGEPWPETKTFYKKRAARILPSYYLSLLLMLIVIAAEGTALSGAVWKDLFAHIFCVAPLFPATYISPYFNGVLWTVQIEVLYYIVMPWLAKLFRKWPVLTCAGLWGVGILSANYIVCNHANEIYVYGNQILTFAGCYANGMLLAVLGLIEEVGMPQLAIPGAILAVAMLVLGACTAGIHERGFGKFTKGFGAVYGIINYLSDILSYARLYGLMLSGAIIAQIASGESFKLIASGNPIFIALAVIILIIGHGFNLAMGLLGGYIHDARLQYIEFFSRFYGGEGELFKPLGSTHKYVKIYD